MGDGQLDSTTKLPTRPAIRSVFFWTAGFYSLFVFGCLLSQLEWFRDRYDGRADFHIPFFFNAGCFMAFLAYDKILVVAKFKGAILCVPVLQAVISIVIFLMGELIEKSKPKYYSMLALVVFSGFSNSIMQTTLIKHTFGFTYIDITAYNSGTALVGIISNIGAMANVYYLRGNANLGYQAMIYLAYQIAVVAVVVYIYMRYCTVCYDPELMAESRAESSAIVEKCVESSDKNSVGTVKETNSMRMSDKAVDFGVSLISTLKIILPYFFNMILLYTITLGIFPGFNIAMGIGWTDSDTFGISIQIILITYNFGDFFGKLAFMYMPLKDGSMPHLLSLARFGFVGFVIFVFSGEGHPEMHDRAWLTLTYSFFLAVTNGYVTSALFALSSERSPANHKSNSAFLMTLALLFGLAYGSLCAAFGSSDD